MPTAWDLSDTMLHNISERQLYFLGNIGDLDYLL